VVAYGVRADETPLRDTVKTLAALAAVDFEAESLDFYMALADKAGHRLSVAAGGIKDVIGETGLKQELLISVKERHESFTALTGTQLHGLENADMYEVSAELFAYETQLKASYSVTARLQGLSIVNFMDGL
jgi:flagellar hook-associated protein 3 FlgL